MKDLICILCPVGCHLTISNNLSVTGNKCPRGIKYAVQELTNPTRTLTSIVKTTSLDTPVLSVKSSKELPKNLVFKVIALLNNISIEKNVKIGDIIVSNVLGTGIDIVATKNVSLN